MTSFVPWLRCAAANLLRSLCAVSYSANDDDDVCLVCRRPCATRWCRCSRVHRECAARYLAHLAADDHADARCVPCAPCATRRRCPICRDALCTVALARVPAGVDDAQLERVEKRMRRATARAQATRYRAWTRDVWPAVVRTLRNGAADGGRVRSVPTALEAVLQDDERATFVQRLMDRGVVGAARHDAILLEMEHASRSYSTLSRGARRSLRQGLCAASFDASDSDSDVDMD